VTEPKPNMLAQALLYAGAGVNVFPVSTNKTPLTGEGGFHHATTDREQIEQWWKQWPDAGIATPDFDVVDVDLYKPESKPTWDRIRDLIPKGRPHNRTGRGGLQFIFAPGTLREGKIGPGVDKRLAGRNYALLPPSRNEGGPYEAVVDLLFRHPKPAPAFPASERENGGRASPIDDVIPEGQRNETLASLAGSMRRRGMGEEAILAALQVTNRDRCRPPLPELDVRRIASSISRYAPADAKVRPSGDAPGTREKVPPPEPFPEPVQVEIVSLDSFLEEREDLPRALIGSSSNAFDPAGGLVIVGGLGGSTKTTFTVDGVAHFASGTPWCGYDVATPLRVLIIENEGPRAFFREKLRAKAEAWTGDPFRQNVYVLRGPWGMFDFRNPDHRGALRAAIDEHDVDLVVADPLTNLGMEGAGSLDDTGKFVRLLRACGLNDPERPVSFWLLHHLNKTKHRDVLQALSGAWDNWADTIVVLKADPEARLSVAAWGKVRYGSLPYDDQTTTFRWTDGYGYERIEKVERDIKAEVLAHLVANDRVTGWLPSEINKPKSKGGIAANIDAVKTALKELEVAGEVVEIDPLTAGRRKVAHPYRSTDSGAQSRYESDGVGTLLAPNSPTDSTSHSPVGGVDGVESVEGADSDPPSMQDEDTVL
jgi:Bifunctional DNA primase/polymerase, N-terminal/AAA domain/Primase C terminal 1 (PriCT-1)